MKLRLHEYTASSPKIRVIRAFSKNYQEVTKGFLKYIKGCCGKERELVVLISSEETSRGRKESAVLEPANRSLN